jgi:hypothetical protein
MVEQIIIHYHSFSSVSMLSNNLWLLVIDSKLAFAIDWRYYYENEKMNRENEDVINDNYNSFENLRNF